jgi:hypothetical protein
MEQTECSETSAHKIQTLGNYPEENIQRVKITFNWINQPDAANSQAYCLSFKYSSTCFRHPHAHHQELQQLQYQPLVLPLERSDSSVVGRGRAGHNRPDHDQQHCYHHDTKVKPETGTAVVELLMMGGRTPETCWAVNKRQDNKMKNCCIWLVIYLNCTMIHGLTNLKFTKSEAGLFS